MTTYDNDIASLFDPQLEDPVPVIPPGALPPSWAAVQQTPASQLGPRAWSEVQFPPYPVAEVSEEVDPQAEDPAVLAEDTRKRERGRKRSKRRGKTPADREKAAAKKRADSARKAVRLQLTGTSGHITRTTRTSTAWFVQKQGPWNFRTTGTTSASYRSNAISSPGNGRSSAMIRSAGMPRFAA